VQNAWYRSKQFNTVAVVCGGVFAEREVSINTGGLMKALRGRGIDAHLFDPYVRPLSALKDERFTRAFNALHGGYGENGQIPGALDFYGDRHETRPALCCETRRRRSDQSEGG
jgi:D-alanine-D-alanine ligase